MPGSKERFSQTYVVSAYNIRNGINPLKVKAYREKSGAFYNRYTASDSCVQLENSALQLLLLYSTAAHAIALYAIAPNSTTSHAIASIENHYH